MPRNISLKRLPVNPHACAMPSIQDPYQWLVIYQDQRACLHHVHTNNEDHLLCGPIVFCCMNAVRNFYLNHSELNCLPEVLPESSDLPVVIRETSAEQIISWMDAGIQVINFIVCEIKGVHGILAAILSGNQARQALKREISLEPFLTENALLSLGVNDQKPTNLD